jgi:hypothetical protein
MQGVTDEDRPTMTRSDLEPLDTQEIEPAASPDRVAWLRACFAPAESLIDPDAGDDADDPGWHPIAFWWPTSGGVQLVLMPCRSLVQ